MRRRRNFFKNTDWINIPKAHKPILTLCLQEKSWTYPDYNYLSASQIVDCHRLECIQDSFKFNYFNSAIGTYTLNSNTWYYGGVTYNSVTSTINLYVNRILTDTTVVALTTGVTNVINIGSVLSTFYLNGNISQISAYNRALTAQEIQHNYNATKSRFGL